MAKFNPQQYEEKLKSQLSCFRCAKDMKNMPTLKAHLEEEWNSMSHLEAQKKSSKREHSPDNDDEIQPKKKS